MKEYERKTLLEKAGRESSFIGATIPKEIDLDGEIFGLQEYVLNTRKSDMEPDGDIKKKLRRKRTDLRKSLEEDDIAYSEGMEIVDTIKGIERALTVLEAEDTDIDAESSRKEKADTQRWMEFLKKVTGSEGGRNGGRR